MLAFAFYLNFLIWYAAFFVSPARLDTGFMCSVGEIKPRFRLPLALAQCLVAFASLYVDLDKYPPRRDVRRNRRCKTNGHLLRWPFVFSYRINAARDA